MLSMVIHAGYEGGNTAEKNTYPRFVSVGHTNYHVYC